jgi:hypothetical protein
MLFQLFIDNLVLCGIFDGQFDAGKFGRGERI